MIEVIIMIMTGFDNKGIVGKYPNSKRHGDPIGAGARSALEAPRIMNKSNEKAPRKHGEF
jgi:hypothetical protein